MQAARFCLVRHGHTAGNDEGLSVRMSGRTDLPLSAEGWAQAKLLGDWFRLTFTNPPPVYASPLRRALDTAATMTAGRVSVRCEADLQEIDCGRADGQTIESVRQTLPMLWAANMKQSDDDFRWPGGESYRELRARVVAAADRLATVHAGSTIVIVTHAGVISQLIGSVLGTSPARWGDNRPDNASITELLWGSGVGQVQAFGDCRHLQRQLQNASARLTTVAQR